MKGRQHPTRRFPTGAGIILAVLSFLCLAAPEVSLGQERLRSVLDGILERYGSLPGLSLAYQRVVITRSMALLGETARKDAAKGLIYFKPPHYLRLEQETPGKEILLSDGKTLWWYIPAKETAYRYSSRSLGEEMRLLSSILQGLKDLEEGFDISEIPGQEAGFYRLRLVPRSPWPQIEHIEITVAAADYQIQSVDLYNHLGDLTHFTLGPPETREKLERDFFRFQVPPGTRVVEEADQ